MSLLDSKIIYFFSGMTIALLLTLFIVVIFPTSNQDVIDDVDNFFPPFRFTVILVYGLWATGIVIRIFLAYKVNYTFIFELDAIKRI